MSPRKSIVIAALAALGSGGALAADQTLSLSSGFASFIGTGPLLDGGQDVITFSGLSPGQYYFDFSLSSQYIGANLTSVTVNGAAASMVSFGHFKYAALSGLDNSPFSVVITGTANASSLYSGELQVTPVPEPETYALMLAGLGAVGFVTRRRRR